MYVNYIFNISSHIKSVKILPRKDLNTGLVRWDTNIGKKCTRELRRLLIKPENEPFLFVSVTFLLNENWWPLPFVDIKIDNQVNRCQLATSL